MAVDGFTVLEQAHTYLLAAVRGVPDGAWGDATPCSEWTVRQVLNHARLDQQVLTMQITGTTPEADPFAPADAVSADPVAELDAVLKTAAAVWWSGAAADSVPTPMGAMPAAAGAATAALDAAVHAWDIAVATGQQLPLSEELAEGLEDIASKVVDFVRDTYGKYAPPLPAPSGAGRADRLLAFTGRDPHWARRPAE